MRYSEEMTEHAIKRQIDRSIPEIALWLLREFGVCRRARDGAESYSFDKRAWREVERFFGPWPLKKMEQLKRAYMVVSDRGAVITVAYRD
ncbi:hypothetical protein [Parvibaculum sp.]|uniref:hypothetical protein n=1 Tax=Parvibaculum sp. TaxID=2024848 RepID=UPI001B1BF4D1|nr:hypothetical protein [Parvibaculum sp.]MBO6666459.1 hypothetical protein [Parvibaculum sp.]MBO6690946.1 hypothetical protein [Parvibaculum sp.]MBO6713080.1 hypothetical protein [Parvibaculum sp.]